MNGGGEGRIGKRIRFLRGFRRKLFGSLQEGEGDSEPGGGPEIVGNHRKGVNKNERHQSDHWEGF